jgi:NTP-dependent ternary system trypsin peptidase co-occuring protein
MFASVISTKRNPGGDMAELEARIPLADLVNAVRAELETAALSARNQQLQFEVQDVQLEVEVMTTGTREAGGGLQVWVVTVGAKGSKANAATQKVTLNLSAVMPDGTKFRVSDISSAPIRRK